MRLFWSSLALLVALGLSAVAGKCQAGAPATGTWIGFVFSRAAPTASVVVGAPTTFVLRAERDVTSLRAELSPVWGADAGAWEARLIALPASEEPAPPGIPDPSRARPLWLKSARVQRGKGIVTTFLCPVPRRVLTNRLLVLTPKSPDAKPVRLRIGCGLVDQSERIQWLMRARSQFSPEEHPEQVRELVRYLTDQEVLHWASLPTREIFQLGWGRMTLEQLDQAFGPGVMARRTTPHRLPNGLHLLLNGVQPVKDPASTLLPEVVSASLLKKGGRGDNSPETMPEQSRESLPGVVVGLAPWSPSYAAEIHEPNGEKLLLFRIHPSARSLSLHLRPTGTSDPERPYSISIECTDWPVVEGIPVRPSLRGLTTVDLKDPGRRWLAGFRSSIGFKPRLLETTWLVRIKAARAGQPGLDGKQEVRAPLSAALKVYVDTTPINARETELMAWREQVDPLAEPDKVRERFSSLSDEEVKYYTNFPTRAAFLKHWMRTKLQDLRNDRGGLVLPPEVSALTTKGRQLPNGKYLHHNGSGIPLD